MKYSLQLGVSCLVVLLSCGTAIAQGGHGGGGGMPGRGGMPGGAGGGMGMPSGGDGKRTGMDAPSGDSIPRSTPSRGSTPAGSAGSNGGANSTNRGGLQLGPPGRWWDDKKFAKTLGLNGDQQKRMDSVFAQNRDALLSRYDSLQRAETRLESLTHADHLDEGALFSEIDHVALARADLEKANTRMLLQIRSEMTAEQIDKLEEHR